MGEIYDHPAIAYTYSHGTIARIRHDRLYQGSFWMFLPLHKWRILHPCETLGAGHINLDYSCHLAENTVKLGPALLEASKPHVSSRSFITANKCMSFRGNTHGNQTLMACASICLITRYDYKRGCKSQTLRSASCIIKKRVVPLLCRSLQSFVPVTHSSHSFSLELSILTL